MLLVTRRTNQSLHEPWVTALDVHPCLLHTDGVTIFSVEVFLPRRASFCLCCCKCHNLIMLRCHMRCFFNMAHQTNLLALHRCLRQITPVVLYLQFCTEYFFLPMRFGEPCST